MNGVAIMAHLNASRPIDWPVMPITMTFAGDQMARSTASTPRTTAC